MITQDYFCGPTQDLGQLVRQLTVLGVCITCAGLSISIAIILGLASIADAIKSRGPR